MPIGIDISIESGIVKAAARGSDEKVGKLTKQSYIDLVGDDRSLYQRCLEKLFPNTEANKFPIIEYKFALTPEADKIEITERSEFQAIASDILRNRSSVPGTYSTTLKEERTNTINVKWSKNVQASRGFQISADLFIKGSGHMNFTTTTGEEVSEQISEVVGSTRAVTVTLDPGQAVIANLQIKRTHVSVKLPIRIDLKIYDAINTSNFVDLDTFLEEGVFDVVCFTDGYVEILDCIEGLENGQTE